MKKILFLSLTSCVLALFMGSCGGSGFLEGDFTLVAKDLDFPEGPSLVP
ncbi:MAG: hypothetical protein U5N26_09445 [Candidatus Marinimicrobia bacterium]|nr:hypothetical protein [Candidatus Neomarinimicrobiota bacterium]